MPARSSNGSSEAESSRKRTRHVQRYDDEDEEEEYDDVQGSSPANRSDSRKRARLSSESTESVRPKRETTAGPASVNNVPSGRESTVTLQNGDNSTLENREEEGEGEGEDESMDETDYLPDPQPTQYEDLRDNNFEHLQDEEGDDLRATQRLRFRTNMVGENAIADNGIIESITCINFMCHTRLHCELGPLLNFIVGENGSGKSAILTAITLCLGGKASATNRGGNLKTFIKEGCSRAVLIVKIKNQGQDAYKHDIFGDSIIVERHFAKTGATSYKIKTANRQVYSTKRSEVEEIVEYYALQVDNPLNILSQDNARQFLNSSSKQQKYKFFIEGVQLQQLDNDYRLISESLDQMIAKVPEQEERVKHAKKKLDEAKRLKELLEGNRQIRIKYRTLRNQMVWKQVEDQEAELVARTKAVAEAAEKILEAERTVEVKSEALRKSDEKIERATEDVRAVKEEESEIKRRAEEANEAFQHAKQEIQRLHHDEREAHSLLKSTEEEVKELERKIAEEQQRLEDTSGEAHTQALEALEKAKNKVARIQGEIEENDKREPELVERVKEAREALKRVDEAYKTKRDEIEVQRTRIRRLEEDRGNPYDAYEAQVPNLLRMIESEGSFENKPIGPLGTHIALLQPQWSSILETFFGKNLNAFLVTSQRDQRILDGMMSRLGIRNCPVLIGNRNLQINTEGKEPDPQFDTILRVLKIDNQLVRDQLIINNFMEQVILIPDRRRAEEVMFDGAPPRNVKMCLCFHDKKRGEGIRLTNTGNMASTPVQPNPRLQPRMKADTASQIAHFKEALRQTESEFKVIENDRRRLQQEAQRTETALKKQKQDKKILESQLRQAQVAVDNAEANLDQFEGIDGRLRGLQEQLTEAKAQREHHGIQYGSLAAKKGDKNSEAEEASKQLKAAKLELREYEAKLDKVEEKHKRLVDTRKIVLAELNEAIAAVEICKEEKEKSEVKYERQVGRVQDFIGQAQEIAPTRVEVPEGETGNSLEAQYHAIGKRLAEQEARHGMTEIQVNENLVESQKTYDKVVEDLKSMKIVNSHLRDALLLRLHKWRMFQRYISSQSRANFIYLLSERGFRGKLLLDHERKALDLIVEPDQTEPGGPMRTTKTLSGGEKSFSSICLLLSIWEAMGSPLRCLDEFDVFMDNVNRAISTNMLITAARRSVNRQYIFITPNSIEGRSALEKDVKVIRLTDPRQRTLADH
ncbi:hypothetical protein QBC46DRAFT_295384 [Diplogelasinospora grovesii]|uniref:RecF/RecN/SMC N-terminal domain-containing protein n=1 Tax=Diplogelasinospora grovesii TaxID=303347 RepID=A0AAN6S1D5_9PEZI|nr:hypothetical protein QBC46DRAFT_295384 [Diplogelasinospora grovesii]